MLAFRLWEVVLLAAIARYSIGKCHTTSESSRATLEEVENQEDHEKMWYVGLLL